MILLFLTLSVWLCCVLVSLFSKWGEPGDVLLAQILIVALVCNGIYIVLRISHELSPNN